MGVRLYNPGTGRFLTVDPVPGGGANAYAYPTDPVNAFDLDGQRWCTRWYCRLASRAAGAASRYAARRAYHASVNAGYRIATYAGYRYGMTISAGRCGRVHGLMTCRARFRGYPRGGITIGGVYITGNDRRTRTASRIRHEKAHRSQWRRHGLAFPYLYWRAGRNPCRNRYEREAGWASGGYRC